MVKPLNSYEINHYLKKDLFAKKIFRFVLPRDKLPKHVNYPSAYIINTHPSHKPGEHWLAVFYDSKGFCTFFDSFARKPREFGLDEFLNFTSTGWTYNTKQVQSIKSATCGYHCIFFVLLMCRGLNLDDILLLFDENNFSLNDFFVSNL